MDKSEVFNIASNYIAYLKVNDYSIVKAILFGSYARGNYNDDSDIDLALIFKNLEDKFITQVKLLMLTHKFDTRIEPHPIAEEDFNSDNPFAEEIMNTGIEIH